MTWLDLACYRQIVPIPREQIPHTTSYLLNWREMGLMDGLFDGEGKGWMAASKELWSKAQCPNGDQ